MFRGVIFDLDGTLVDGYDAIAAGVNAARARFGLPPLAVDDVRGRVGLGLSHLMDDVVGPERADEGAAIFRATYDDAWRRGTRAVPSLSPTLNALRARGSRLSVASNKPVRYSRLILEHLGVAERFDLVAGPETAGAIKPDPAMLHACLRAMALPADQAVYVGDMALDADAGARAGVAVVLVAGGSSARDELLATGRPVLDRLADLPEWLAGTPQRDPAGPPKR
ncbi:MAG TPA: HAD family hydrolase [Candidatus Polarisedimenticolaceae bacterium]|nr:HAD family hydrolase [Candidatus Polarisedimenticolaceae bacterium]